MQGQTSLLSRAQRVQQDYDLQLEEGLFLDLAARVTSRTRDWQRLGDPRSIILESELVIRLAARLRTAPWATVVMAPRSGGALMALLLINTLLTAVRGSDDSGGFDTLKPLVLQTVVRQVCCCCACCCLGDCTCMPCCQDTHGSTIATSAAGERPYSGKGRGCFVGKHNRSKLWRHNEMNCESF